MKGPISRRAALRGVAGTAAAAALHRMARAQQPVTIRWWGGAGSPAQRAAFDGQIKAFEAANPGVHVVFEGMSAETYPAQLAAAFASKQLPHVVTHLPSFAAATYWNRGLLAPFNDVIKAIGEDKYYPHANDVYRARDGQYFGTPIGNTAADMLWVRRDLMQKAGIEKIPETWDELRAACRKMQGRGVYGAPYPYGFNGATSLIIIGFIHRAGGQIFSPELEVAVVSDQAVQALEFYKSMKEFCPPGATNYSWGEMVNGFASGACATGIYAGRVLQNVHDQNPGIADQITCTVYPTIGKSVAAWTFNDFPGVFIPAAVENLEQAKAFAAFLFKPPGYITELHAAPGHIVPVLKTIAEDPAYLANPLIKQYPKEVELITVAAANGFNLGYESREHKQNAKAGQIIASNAMAELVQRVVLNGDDIKTALGDTAKKLEQIMKT
jgi:multiple sugar transport system substrate-binding protein